MNWKALLITIGLFIGIAALVWLCVVFNVIIIVLCGLLALCLGALFYEVYAIIASILE